MAPLFNLVNGDLCYANLAQDRIRTWSDWFDNNTRSARYRPWMPAAGNHENELGNGPIGYGAYQTYFAVPDSGASQELRGLWYSITAGSVRVIVLNNDDICFQDAGNSYVHGYSGGEQKRWLQSELAAARRDPAIDWVVACMHQTAISTADHTNGADLGIRQEWLPLFDQYEVDLVVCGHEHHYERSHPLRGTMATDTRTPIPVSTRTDLIDPTKGTVHLVIGGGGTANPSNAMFFPNRVAAWSPASVISIRRCGTRRRSMCRRTRPGRRFGTASTRTVSSLSTSIPVRRAATRRSRRPTTRSADRSARSPRWTTSR